MDELMLVEPNEEMENQAMNYRLEYIEHGENGINGSCGLFRYEVYTEWLNRVFEAHHAKTSFCHVPATTYFSVRKRDNRIIGTVQLRHELTATLKKHGGHIGYGIRPSERKKDYATQQLALVIEKAKALNIPRVMITCHRNNVASAKTAIKNGGKLSWEGFDEEGGEIQIYWIDIL